MSSNLNVLSEVMGLHRWPSHSRQPFNFTWDTSVINDSFWHVEFITSSRNFPLTLYTLLYAKETDGQFSCSVMFNSLQPHGLHARPPCPPPMPRVYSNSCPLSRTWCHPTISSSVDPFSSCLQSLPALRSFQMSQFFEFHLQHQSFQWIFRTDFL